MLAVPPTPPSADRGILATCGFAGLLLIVLCLFGCGSKQEIPAVREVKQAITTVQDKNAANATAAASGKAALQHMAVAQIEARYASILESAKASPAEKASALAHQAADEARALAIQTEFDAQAADVVAKAADKAAEAQRKHDNIVAIQATCHWIAGILVFIAVLAVIDIVAGFFFTQVSRTVGIAEGVAGTGFAAAGAVEVIAFLAPYLWWAGAAMLVVVVLGFLWHKYDLRAKTAATGDAADALTTAALAKVKTEMGGDALHAMVAPIEAAWKKVWGGVKPLVDKVTHTP